MPEGHIVHRLADEVNARFARRVVAVSSPQGRFAESAALLDGLRLRKADAVGKHLFIEFQQARIVHVHLGIYGRFTFGDLPVPEPVGEIRLRMVSSRGWADLRGANRCALITPAEREAVEQRLGDDPLRNGRVAASEVSKAHQRAGAADGVPAGASASASSGDRAWTRVSGSRAPIATLLMDQSVAAGVGNIFRAEVLFRAGIDPQRPGRDISRSEWESLWQDLAHLMLVAYERGRIDTVKPEHEPEVMGREPRVDRHGGEVYVYRRAGQACLVCGDEVRTSVHAGRHLYWCPTCQRS